MKLLHVALTAGSEEKSDSFFVGLLGLEKMEPKTIPAALTEKLFDLTGVILAVNYLNSSVRFEVFIMSNPPDPGPGPDHVCIEVKDRAATIEKALAMGLDVRQAPKGESVVVFIRDFFGNQFEIVQGA